MQSAVAGTAEHSASSAVSALSALSEIAASSDEPVQPRALSAGEASAIVSPCSAATCGSDQDEFRLSTPYGTRTPANARDRVLVGYRASSVYEDKVAAIGVGCPGNDVAMELLD